jgi:hypothetical protein
MFRRDLGEFIFFSFITSTSVHAQDSGVVCRFTRDTAREGCTGSRGMRRLATGWGLSESAVSISSVLTVRFFIRFSLLYAGSHRFTSGLM